MKPKVLAQPTPALRWPVSVAYGLIAAAFVGALLTGGRHSPVSLLLFSLIVGWAQFANL